MILDTRNYTHNEEIRVGGDNETYSMNHNYWESQTNYLLFIIYDIHFGNEV